MIEIARRDILAGGGGLALLAGARSSAASVTVDGPVKTVTATDFGAAGDGTTDDTDAIRRTLETALTSKDVHMAVIPPGRYRITRTIRIVTEGRPEGNITHQTGVQGAGAMLVSDISDGSPVVEIVCRATLRFFLIDGLQIKGNGSEGHGISIQCNHRGTYFYNFCLRDVIVEGCGGDGCRMIGNVFEGQLFNTYFRDNGGNGATFGHGPENTVFSAVHVFGSVFGGNGKSGVRMIDGAADVSFHGCYFLLNKKFGLSADTGCTLLSHCGFENNHMASESFANGDAGLRLMVGGTLISCTAYSIYHQTHLIRSYVSNSLTMVGCTADGGQEAAAARLANLDGEPNADINIIGCSGGVDRKAATDITSIGAGARFGGDWDSSNLPWLGNYCLWIDDAGRLRVKRGRPEHDTDGWTLNGQG